MAETKTEQIRLACMVCDRRDSDGISTIPDDWVDIEESPFNVTPWWTHIGYCPDCKGQAPVDKKRPRFTAEDLEAAYREGHRDATNGLFTSELHLDKQWNNSEAKKKIDGC